MKKILFATSEAVPFVKTGGLADVAGSLPKYFNKEEYDVRVMLPKYLCIKEEWRNKMEYVTHFYMDWKCDSTVCRRIEAEFMMALHFILLIMKDILMDSHHMEIYYGDVEKFAFFSKAVLQYIAIDRFPTGHHSLS